MSISFVIHDWRHFLLIKKRKRRKSFSLQHWTLSVSSHLTKSSLNEPLLRLPRPSRQNEEILINHHRLMLEWWSSTTCLVSLSIPFCVPSTARHLHLISTREQNKYVCPVFRLIWECRSSVLCLLPCACPMPNEARGTGNKSIRMIQIQTRALPTILLGESTIDLWFFSRISRRLATSALGQDKETLAVIDVIFILIIPFGRKSEHRLTERIFFQRGIFISLIRETSREIERLEELCWTKSLKKHRSIEILLLSLFLRRIECGIISSSFLLDTPSIVELE